MRTSFIFCLLAANTAGAAPDWVGRGQSPRYPRDTHLVGFAQVEGVANVERAKAQAAADLARGISVRIESHFDELQVEDQTGARASISARTRASADVHLSGLGYEIHSAPPYAYALAYVARRDVARGEREARDRALADAERLLKEAEKLEGAAALGRLYGARRALLEAQQRSAVVTAIAPKDPSDGAAIARFAELGPQLDGRAQALLGRPVANLADAAQSLVLQMNEQGVSRQARLVVEPLAYGATRFSSAFGRALAQGVERAFASAPAGTLSGDIVVRGSYLVGANLELQLVAKESPTGRLLASAVITMPKSAVPAELPLVPENLQTALQSQRLFAEGEAVSGDLKVEVWANKGDRNLVYSEGEELKLFLRVNRPSYIRLIYLLASGHQVPLEQAFFIDASKVNKAVEYPEAFEVSRPFGVEQLHVTAFTEKPALVPTKKVDISGETYEVLAESLAEVVGRTRGLKKKSGAAQQAEAALAITTLPR